MKPDLLPQNASGALRDDPDPVAAEPAQREADVVGADRFPARERQHRGAAEDLGLQIGDSATKAQQPGLQLVDRHVAISRALLPHAVTGSTKWFIPPTPRTLSQRQTATQEPRTVVKIAGVALHRTSPCISET